MNLSKSLQVPTSFKDLFTTKSRYKVYYGGRGSGKSWNFASALIYFATQRRIRVLCAREIQKSVAESVHKVIATQIERMGAENHFKITDTSILCRNGSEFIFEGLFRNQNKIKSLEGIDFVWVEEAENISETSWDLLIPTIRKENSEIWISFNPRFKEDATYQKFIVNTPPNTIIKKVSYLDNPFFPEVLEQERVFMKETDPVKYLHIWEGETNDSLGKVFNRDNFKIISHKQFEDYTNFEVDEFWELEDGYNPSSLISFMAVDVAVTQTDKSDNSAITVGCIDGNNNIYVKATIKGKWLSDELLERVIRTAKDYDVQYIGIEDSSISKTFIENFESALINRNLPYLLYKLKTKGRNKVARIQQYILSCMNNNRLYFVDSLDEDLLTEAINFPDGKHDDQLDSLAYFIEMGYEHLQQSGMQQVEFVPVRNNKGNSLNVY